MGEGGEKLEHPRRPITKAEGNARDIYLQLHRQAVAWAEIDGKIIFADVRQ